MNLGAGGVRHTPHLEFFVWSPGRCGGILRKDFRIDFSISVAFSTTVLKILWEKSKEGAILSCSSKVYSHHGGAGTASIVRRWMLAISSFCAFYSVWQPGPWSCSQQPSHPTNPRLITIIPQRPAQSSHNSENPS